MYLPTTHDGMKSAIGWYCATVIIGKFDAGLAEYHAKKAVDPNYQPNPFAVSKARPIKSDPLADYCARIRAGGGSRDGMRTAP